MAGLQSQNISIASTRVPGGSSLDKNTCVFCRRRATPPASDPHAPQFAFFSLVDCRHYACQPCALVHCDNAGRFIKCPTCQCISRLAQSGRKRTASTRAKGHGNASRVSLDDGASSIASRRTLAGSTNTHRPRSALKRTGSSEEHKRRSSSVQFQSTPATSAAEKAVTGAEEGEHGETASPKNSALTQEALSSIPVDPAVERRQRREQERLASKPVEPTVGLYSLSAPPVRRHKERSRSEPPVELPKRILGAPTTQPFPKPPPLVIHTIEEDEREGAGLPPTVPVPEAPDEKDEASEAPRGAALPTVADEPPAEAAQTAVAAAVTEKEEEEEVRAQEWRRAQEQEWRRAREQVSAAHGAERLALVVEEQSDLVNIQQLMDENLAALHARRPLDEEFDLSPGTPQTHVGDTSDQVSDTSDDESAQASHRPGSSKRRHLLRAAPTDPSHAGAGLTLSAPPALRRAKTVSVSPASDDGLRTQEEPPAEHGAARRVDRKEALEAVVRASEANHVLYRAELEDEERVARLGLSRDERHAWYSGSNSFYLALQTIVQRQATARLVAEEAARNEAAVQQSEGRRRLRDLVLSEEEERLKFEQSVWSMLRRVWRDAVEERGAAESLELLRSTAAQQWSLSAEHRLQKLVQALLEEESSARLTGESLERRAWVTLTQRALQAEEEAWRRTARRVPDLQEWSDSARRHEQLSQCVQMVQDEGVERAALLHQERKERLACSQEEEAWHAQCTALSSARRVDAYADQLERQRAAQQHRGQLAGIEETEFLGRSGVGHQESKERIGWIAEECSHRVAAAMAEADRLQHEQEVLRYTRLQARLVEAFEEVQRRQEEQRAQMERQEHRTRLDCFAAERADAKASEEVMWVRMQREAAHAQHARLLEQQRRIQRCLEEVQRDEEDKRYVLCEHERNQLHAIWHPASHELAMLRLREASEPLRMEKGASSEGSFLASLLEVRQASLTKSQAQTVEAPPSATGSYAVRESSAGGAPASPWGEPEEIQQLRVREREREEELVEANARLRVAERRLEEEARTRARAEEERHTALEAADRLVREAEHRAEERIRRVREMAEQELTERLAAMQDAHARRTEHEATMRALEEQERRAVLEAKLLAAERALEDARERATRELHRAREEAAAKAADEATRMERVARELQADHEAKRHAEAMLQRAEREAERAEAAAQLRHIEERARAALHVAQEEAQRAAAEDRRRLEELQQRQATHTAALRHAQVQVDEAREDVRVFDAQRGTAEAPATAPPPNTTATTTTTSTSATTAGATSITTSTAAAAPPTAATTSATSATSATSTPAPPPPTTSTTTAAPPPADVSSETVRLIRTAIGEAVQDIVRARDEAWRVAEEAEHQMYHSNRRYQRLEADRAEAERSLLQAETSLDASSVHREGPPDRGWSPSTNSTNRLFDSDVAPPRDRLRSWPFFAPRGLGIGGRGDAHRRRGRRPSSEAGPGHLLGPPAAPLTLGHPYDDPGAAVAHPLEDPTAPSPPWRSHTREDAATALAGTAEREAPSPSPRPDCPLCHRTDTLSTCWHCREWVCRTCGPPPTSVRLCCRAHHRDVRQRPPPPAASEAVEGVARNPPAPHDAGTSPIGIVPTPPRPVYRRLHELDDEGERESLAGATAATSSQPDDADDTAPRVSGEEGTSSVGPPPPPPPSATAELLGEPKTERKKYEAFFVPLGTSAVPRRPKPPTPRNYGHFLAAREAMGPRRMKSTRPTTNAPRSSAAGGRPVRAAPRTAVPQASRRLPETAAWPPARPRPSPRSMPHPLHRSRSPAGHRLGTAVARAPPPLPRRHGELPREHPSIELESDDGAVPWNEHPGEPLSEGHEERPGPSPAARRGPEKGLERRESKTSPRAVYGLPVPPARPTAPAMNRLATQYLYGSARPSPQRAERLSDPHRGSSHTGRTSRRSLRPRASGPAEARHEGRPPRGASGREGGSRKASPYGMSGRSMPTIEELEWRLRQLRGPRGSSGAMEPSSSRGGFHHVSPGRAPSSMMAHPLGPQRRTTTTAYDPTITVSLDLPTQQPSLSARESSGGLYEWSAKSRVGDRSSLFQPRWNYEQPHNPLYVPQGRHRRRRS